MVSKTRSALVGSRRPPLLFAVYMYPEGGGISSILENCVERLEGAYEVHVAIAVGRDEPRAGLPLSDERVHVLGSSNVLHPLLMPTSVLYTVRVGRFLRSLVRTIQPAAVLVQDALLLPVPALYAAAGASAKVALMDHGTLSNVLDRDWQATVRRRLPPLKRLAFVTGFAFDRPWRAARWRIGLSAADAVWYVGEELRPLFSRAGSRAAEYAQLIPTDFAEPSAEARRMAREDLRLPEAAVGVNMVTRLSGEKGLELVLDGLESIRAERPELVLLVAGFGALEKWFLSEVERRGLDAGVRFLGPLDRSDVKRLHHASDFHLYAGTIGCGVSISLLEAMACGVIPIVSDVPRAHRRLVGDAGWVFRANDREALIAALRAAVTTTAAQRSSFRCMIRGQLDAYSHPSLDELVDGLVSGQ